MGQIKSTWWVDQVWALVTLVIQLFQPLVVIVFSKIIFMFHKLQRIVFPFIDSLLIIMPLLKSFQISSWLRIWTRELFLTGAVTMGYILFLHSSWEGMLSESSSHPLIGGIIILVIHRAQLFIRSLVIIISLVLLSQIKSGLWCLSKRQEPSTTYSISSSASSTPLSLVFSDVWGPARILLVARNIMWVLSMISACLLGFIYSNSSLKYFKNYVNFKA
jgi:hypothetical protein